jgi:hypothetical protein
VETGRGSRKVSVEIHGVGVDAKKRARKPTASKRYQAKQFSNKNREQKIANKSQKNHKQKIPHFIHSHLEAKGNRWYNLKDCMKTKPRQLKKSFSGTGSAKK